MRQVRVVNQTRAEVLAERAELATSHWARFWGLMGRHELPQGSGLVLQPGGGIHTWFMRIPIDVIHVGQNNVVSHVLHGIRPWRFGPLFVGSKQAIELPIGGAEHTRPGDEILIEPVTSSP